MSSRYMTATNMTAEGFITTARQFGWNATDNYTLVKDGHKIFLEEQNGRVYVKGEIHGLQDQMSLVDVADDA